MKKIIMLLAFMCLGRILYAQQPYIYTIKADSVKITNTCDTAELIIENHTQNVPGFLFNKGKGRTEFRRGSYALNDSIYIIGADTLDFGKALAGKYFRQGGNSFGTAALLGTKDNYPLTFLQNGNEKGRIETSGNWLFNTTQDNGRLAQFNGNVWTSGNIYQQKNITIIPSDGGWGDNTINIGRDNSVFGNANVALGQGLQVSGEGGILAFGVGYYNTVNSGGVGIFGSTDGGIAIGQSSYAHRTSVALGAASRTTASFQFVCGGPDINRPEVSYANVKTDIYFGSGVQRNDSVGNGVAYTIHGSGAYGTNYTGGDITIAGGKGTGSAASGNIIFSTASSTSSGATFQSLSEKARIVGTSGNFLINTATDNGNKLQVNGSSYFNGAHSVTGTASVENGGAHTNFYPTVTSTGADYSIFNGMRMAPVLNFSSNNQQAYALSIEPTFNTNGFSQNTDGISAAMRVYSNWGGIKLDQHSSMPGNSGQPLYIEQSVTANKEFIRNFRNNNLSTLPFIWNHDARPAGNKSAIVPALRSTITFPDAGGGISFTLDRYYYGTDASIDLKYETYPDGDNSSTWNTSIAFNTKSSGSFVTPLYLNGSKVGMGTSTPSAQLHTTGSVRFAGLTSNSSLTRFLVSDANGNLYYKEDSSFGTFNGSFNSDVAVNGHISAQKMLITQTGRWPDYVFSKQYQLPSLAEVESFINQNNHLPGIPSAAEVENKGIDVGNSQAALLKKVEELTLYAIEQDKKIQKQEKEIAELKDQSKELELLKQQMAELKAWIKKQ